MQANLKPTVLSHSVEADSAVLELLVPVSPWFEGHFTEQQPVLPGIAMVLWAKAAFQEHLQLQLSSDVPRIKFRQLVRPNARLQLRLARGKRPSFAYHNPEGSVVCSGQFIAANQND